MSHSGEPLIGFEQLIGQSALAARLRSALGQGRIAHAVIFAGLSGSGKRTVASIYARALLCSGAGHKPCNTCPSCRKALAGNHADLHLIRPGEEGKSLGVDDARSLQRLIDVRPYEGGRAVVVIESAHDMTTQAQNALLKTLEEPPGHVVLILLAETLSPLLPTILSRCVIYKMGRLDLRQMREVLLSRGCADDARTAHATAMADGRPGRALALLEDDTYWPLKDKATQMLDLLSRGANLAEAMKFTQDHKARVGDILTIWESALRDAAIAETGARLPYLLGEEPGKLRMAGAEALERRLSACMIARRALDGNAMYTMTMDRLLLELSGGN